MRRYPALIAMLACCAAAPAPAPDPPPPPIRAATIDETLEVAGDAIAARRLGARMTVAVKVDGQGPYRFLVDSGADRSVIGAALAARLALPADDPVTLRSITGTSRVGTVRIATLDTGPSRIEGVIAPALPEEHLGAQGMLGIDALAGQRMLIDYEARAITIEDARRPMRRIGPDEIVVTARRRRGQLILTEATIAARRLYAIVDTGSEITIGNLALRRRVFGERRRLPATPITITSVTGESVVADLVILPEMKLGGMTFRDMPIAFADVAPFALFGLDRDPALLLGADVMQSFRRIALDFRNRKVRFVLRRGARLSRTR